MFVETHFFTSDLPDCTPTFLKACAWKSDRLEGQPLETRFLGAFHGLVLASGPPRIASFWRKTCVDQSAPLCSPSDLGKQAPFRSPPEKGKLVHWRRASRRGLLEGHRCMVAKLQGKRWRRDHRCESPSLDPSNCSRRAVLQKQASPLREARALRCPRLFQDRR